MTEKPFAQVATELSPEIYQKLKHALEIGRWDNGTPVTEQQQQISMQAILHYEAQHLPPEQRTGYIPSQCKSQSQSNLQTNEIRNEEKPLRWQD